MKKAWIWALLLYGVTQAQHLDFTTVDFHQADSIAALYKGESLHNVPVLAHQLTASLPSDVAKFRAIYTWVSTTITSDYNGFIKNTRKRKKLQHDSLALAQWNRKFRQQTFRKLLKENKTVCTGYAYIIKELANLAGIPCEIVNGYSRTADTQIHTLDFPNHSWNAVRLNDQWYLCDATWSSGFFDTEEHLFIHDYNKGYFLASPELFAKNHYPIDPNWTLLDPPPTTHTFLNTPLVYNDAFRYHIIPIEPNIMDNTIAVNEAFTFLCKAPKTLEIDDISITLNSGLGSYTITPDCIRTESGLLKLTYKFKKPGYYDVHIHIEKQPIVTYTIAVKRKAT